MRTTESTWSCIYYRILCEKSRFHRCAQNPVIAPFLIAMTRIRFKASRLGSLPASNCKHTISARVNRAGKCTMTCQPRRVRSVRCQDGRKPNTRQSDQNGIRRGTARASTSINISFARAVALTTPNRWSVHPGGDLNAGKLESLCERGPRVVLVPLPPRCELAGPGGIAPPDDFGFKRRVIFVILYPIPDGFLNQ